MPAQKSRNVSDNANTVAAFTIGLKNFVLRVAARSCEITLWLEQLAKKYPAISSISKSSLRIGVLAPEKSPWHCESTAMLSEQDKMLQS